MQQEWLVTDQRGAFAMGTSEGIRTRKYHGFYLEISGRGELGGLLDLDIEWEGQAIWPHCYSGENARVIHPDPCLALARFSLEKPSSWPNWNWVIHGSELGFRILSEQEGVIALEWSLSRNSQEGRIKIRPLFAMRPLHAVGGTEWSRDEGSVSNRESRKVSIRSEGGTLEWKEDAKWFRDFLYAEERARGYPAQEDLASAGFYEGVLRPGERFRLLLSAGAVSGKPRAALLMTRESPLRDFLLAEPAGIVAGYPWFGEWGRDSFVALPGMVAGLRGSMSRQTLWEWTKEILDRWAAWIDRDGMLPNLLERSENGAVSPQWEAADATLWWCHALAALWQLSLLDLLPRAELEERYRASLGRAISAIRDGRHRFLVHREDRLLEVIAPHATWMDARVNGVPSTPRTGRLPEINALWFQACCLHDLWSERSDFESVVEHGERVLAHGGPFGEERDRPNFVFLHSVPLAPSFVVSGREGARERLKEDLHRLRREFWTPVGLRTAAPSHPQYQPRYLGTQDERDRVYHQGAAWGWLGGHYEMARMRLEGEEKELESFPVDRMATMPIIGHVAELFDGEEPFAARGAPAQAWSLACIEEARTRKSLKTDRKLTEVLARRWAGRRTDRGPTEMASGQ